MIVVSNSSPLITLAKIGRLELLPKLYGSITITPHVYTEVAINGKGLAGSAEIASAQWINTKPVSGEEALRIEQQSFKLGIGELSTIILGSELKADLVLIDDSKGRRAAQERGLAVLGCVGVLEDAFGMRLLSELTEAYGSCLLPGRMWIQRSSKPA